MIFNYLNFLFKIYFVKLKVYILWWFTENPLISSEFLTNSMNESFYSFLKNIVFGIKLSFDFFVKVWFGFCYLIGFFTLLAQIRVYFGLTDKQATFLIILTLIIFLMKGGNFLIRFVSWLSYWFCLLKVFSYAVFDQDLWTYYGYLLIFMAMVRPLWNFLVELSFFFLIKKIYHCSWFWKLLPYLSPNFDASKAKQELKGRKKSDDYFKW